MIKIIDVFGQFDSKGTNHYYTYPNGTLSPNGIRAFLDPRSDLNGFNITEAFALFCTATEGWWISIIKKNFDDTRQGYAMLSLCLGDQRPVNGAEAAQVLRQAFAHFVTNCTWDDAQSASWLQSIQTTPCNTTPFAGPNNLDTNSAYRTYGSEAELTQQLSHISQRGYEKYSRIFLISAAATTVPTASASRMHNVTDEIPVRQFFKFDVLPAGVKISHPAGAFSGETVQITYTKGALESMPIDYKVGFNANEAYVDTQKGLITIKPAQGLGITFYLKINFSFVDEKGNSLTGIHPPKGTNDFKYDSKDKIFYASENLLQGRGEIGPFTCQCYEPRKVKVEELRNAQDKRPIRVVFRSQKFDIIAKVGNYNIPLAHNFSQRDAKRLEKDGLIELTNGKYFVKEADKDSVLDIFFKIMGLIFTILLVVYMIYALAAVCFDFKIWPFQQDAPQTVQTTDDENTGSTDAADTYNAGTISEEDIDYLKKKDIWDTTALQSEQAKNLLTAISSGDVTSIINQHDATLATIDQNRINGHWKKIIDMLKNIQNDGEKMGNAQANISRICASGKFNLSELQSALQTICKASQSQGETRHAEAASATTEHRETTKRETNSKDKGQADKGSGKSSNNAKSSSTSNPQEKSTKDQGRPTMD